jgi:hypothetical protein
MGYGDWRSKKGSAQRPEQRPEWKIAKPALKKLFHNKCAYCESQVGSTRYGNVDHFRPKRDAAGLDKSDIDPEHYWWLAYDWDNYLLSCPVCNQKWKLAYFPVQEIPRKLPPVEDPPETPLLLNPFFGEDPAKHLEFGWYGEITAYKKSEYGRTTIDVCGLDRQNLRDARELNVGRAHELVEQYRDPGENDPVYITHLLDLYRLLLPSQPHSGLVRIIFKQETKKSWINVARKLTEKRGPVLVQEYLATPEDHPRRRRVIKYLSELADPDNPYANRVKVLFEQETGESWDDFIVQVEALSLNSE